LAGRFGGSEVDGNGNLCAAAFLCARLVPFVRQKVFQGGEEEGTKSPAGFVGAGQEIFFQQPRKKLLGKVLGVMRRMADPAHIGVKGVPVCLTKPGEGVAGRCGVRAAGGQNDGPVSRDERGSARFNARFPLGSR
jgi:hypothetical protein